MRSRQLHWSSDPSLSWSYESCYEQLMRTAAILLVCVFCSSCHTRTRIQPAEVPKLNGSTRVDLGHSGTPSGDTRYAVTVSNVKKPDGTLHQVKGEFDLLLCVRGQGCTFYEHPVDSRLEGNTLHVLSGNNPPASFSMDDVTGAAVEEYNALGTVLTIAVGSGVVALLLLVAL